MFLSFDGVLTEFEGSRERAKEKVPKVPGWQRLVPCFLGAGFQEFVGFRDLRASGSWVAGHLRAPRYFTRLS